MRALVLALLFGVAAASPTMEDQEQRPAGGLLLHKQCGETVCDTYKYCSDLWCHDCDKVCKNQTNNYDPRVCEEMCQDYIHDYLKHYIRESDSYKLTNELQDTIEWLRTLVAVSITLNCLIVLGLVSAAGYFFLKFRRKKMVKRKVEQGIMDGTLGVSAICNNNEKDKSLSLHISPLDSTAVTAVPSVITTTTPISTRRHPCEDATLEFAYDNAGLTPSPILNPPRHETTF